MTFNKNRMECEILTEYMPSLVCTINGKDIIVRENNKIELNKVKIGTNLKNAYHNKFLDGYSERGNSQVNIVSALCEGDWEREDGFQMNLF